jgi:hypothetical protein
MREGELGSCKNEKRNVVLSTWWERAGYSVQEAELFQKVLWHIEQSYRYPHTVPRKAGAAEKLNRRRFAAVQRRRLLKSLQRPLPRNLPKEILIAKQRNNDALTALCPDRQARWVPILSRTRYHQIDLSNFSFLENPTGTIEAFRSIAKAENDGLDVRLNFVDENCADVGAMLLLEEIWPSLCPVFNGGQIAPMVAQMVEAVGLRKAMRWRPLAASEKDQNIFPFPFRRQDRAGGKISAGVEPQKSQLVATSVVSFINLSLRAASGVSLTRKARQNFHGLIGEILDNAGAHSQPDQRGGYSICGFLQRRETEEGEEFRFNLGFLSMGQTVAEGLEAAPPEIAPAMEDYVRRHVGKNQLTEENLRTVYALRDGVTRLREKLNVVEAKSLGGTGFADMLDFFAGLALLADPRDTPKLAIVSGSTYILASAPFRQAIRKVPEGETEASAMIPRELWFNQKNEENEPPDPRHVYSLPGKLQGTLVTMAFNLDPHLLEKLNEAKNGSSDDKG